MAVNKNNLHCHHLHCLAHLFCEYRLGDCIRKLRVSRQRWRMHCSFFMVIALTVVIFTFFMLLALSFSAVGILSAMGNKLDGIRAAREHLISNRIGK